MTVLPGTVEDSVKWFAEHTHPDLLFLDIQLSDGISFAFIEARLEKIRSDSYVMDFKPCEISEIVNIIIADFRHLFPEKIYTVSGKSMLRCDKAWISEAIGNIIKNASEHTAADGRVSVDISESENSTIIEINDNGGGISPDEIPKLFKRFYRTDNSAPNSAGIGLPITKAIVEKHHGIITVENKNGGLCVTMCFPHIDGCTAI